MSLLHKFITELQNFFETYKEHHEVHVTNDGQKFFTANDATNHARTLPDTGIQTITRSQVETFAPPATEEEAASPAAEEEETAPPAEEAAPPAAEEEVAAPNTPNSKKTAKQ